MTAHVSMLVKSHVSLACFQACFLPGWAKDLSAPQYNFNEWIGNTVVTYWRKQPFNVKNISKEGPGSCKLSRNSRVFQSVESVSYK